MNRMALGTLLGLGLVTAAIAVAEQGSDVYAQHTTPAAPGPAVAAGSELIVVPTSLGEKGQMLTVVDPRQRVLSVYHIDLSTGKISLKSVRNIQWDLQMADFNNAEPTPRQIQSQLEQR